MSNTIHISGSNSRIPGGAVALQWAPLERLDLGSIAVDQHSHAALIDEVLHHALHGTTTRQVVTANAQFYVLAQKSRRYRECLRGAHYICADGMPIVWACSTLYGGHIPRIAGVNLMERLCALGAAHRLRVFLLGGRPGAASTTAYILKNRYPGIEIAGVNCPPFGFERDQDSLENVLGHIARARPHVVYVGLGAPKQEFFIRDHIRRLHVPLAIGIGGSFDILSGRLKRAPTWMQTSGLEWVYRLSQEPERLWKRYLIGNAEFLWYISKARFTAASQKNDELMFGSQSGVQLRDDGRDRVRT
jgi:N-acetylglucosaminyldiphosphoundecaprenol N-acetyl-beta-D-mannosaminyltransferase